MPQSLSGEDAHTAAVSLQKLLESYKVTDVEVEFMEPVSAQSASPTVSTSNPPPPQTPPPAFTVL
jgi:hypothetical protein